MSVQIIEKNGQPEWAVLPYEEYQRLVAEAEMLQDIGEYDEVKSALANGAEELIPGAVTYALLDGQNPMRAWREYRSLTQQQVAAEAGISKPYLSQLESGRRKGTTEVLAAVARALKVSLEDLVMSEVDG
jgi:DNA-binding XRE family transcriptional regulator